MFLTSNVLDVLLTYDNKSIMRVAVVVIDHHVGNNRFNPLTAGAAYIRVFIFY